MGTIFQEVVMNRAGRASALFWCDKVGTKELPANEENSRSSADAYRAVFHSICSTKKFIAMGQSCT
jgi:hypothetical protein